MLMRRQFQRAFAGVGRVPGGGGGGGAPPAVMIITPGPIIIGPPGALPATLKLMLLPTFNECARERASPSTSTTLANSGSGRAPSTGALRLRPRMRFSPLVCEYIAFTRTILV